MTHDLAVPLVEHLARPDITDAIRRHAISKWPEESCGIITARGFVALANEHPNPLEEFSCEDGIAPYLEADQALALVHSHPTPAGHKRTGQDWPNAVDMMHQGSMDIPWGLLTCRNDSASIPWFWGGHLPPVPLVGRAFRHGPTGTDGRGDCYAVIKDWFNQVKGIDLLDLPRDWEWWSHPDDLPEHNIYEHHFAQAGFRMISHTEVRIGDCAMIIMPSQGAGGGGSIVTKPNHGAVYVGDGNVLHHMPHQLSAIEPLRGWSRMILRWVRHAALEG